MSGTLNQCRMPDGEPINRHECIYCFNDNLRNEGEFLCLYCDTCICLNHCQLHNQRCNHRKFVMVKSMENDVDIVCYDFDQQNNTLVVNPNPTEEEQVSIALILDSPVNMRFRILEENNSLCRCEHANNLIEQTASSQTQQKIASPEIKCGQCGLEHNLWLCLTCGQINCGRQQPGFAGNGHGVAHGKETGHPLVLRIDSLCRNVQEVYCYTCDDTVKVPVQTIETILNGLGLEGLIKRQNAAKALSEAYRDQLTNIQSESQLQLDPDGPELQPDNFTKTFVRKLRNAGNTCYANAVINCLLSGQLKRNVIFQHMIDCKKQFQFCCGCQLGRLACSPATQQMHAVNFLISLNSDLTSPSNAGKQQDAGEFFNILMKRLKLPYLKRKITRICSQCQNPFGDSYSCNDSSVFLSPDEKFIQQEKNDFDIASTLNNQTDGISRCKKCEQDVEVKLNVEVNEAFPPMLVVQLNRVRYDPTIQNIIKINYNINNYEQINVCGQNYQFYGAVVHIGSNYISGHYIAIIKSNNQWIMANDQYINWISEQQAKNIVSQAYMLFYDKI